MKLNTEIVDVEPIIRLKKNKTIHQMKPIYPKNYEAYLFCMICLDDWEDIWSLKELELYINAENPEDAHEKIVAYLDEKYLDFDILFANVKKIREEDK